MSDYYDKSKAFEIDFNLASAQSKINRARLNQKRTALLDWTDIVNIAKDIQRKNGVDEYEASRLFTRKLWEEYV